VAVVLRTLTLGLVTTLATASLVACDAPAAFVSHGPRLVVPDAEFGVRHNHVDAGVPYSFDDVVLCLDEAGEGTIESVELANPAGGLELRGFSVRKEPPGAMLNYIENPEASTLEDEGFPDHGPFVVAGICPSLQEPESESEDSMSLLGLELERGDAVTDEPAYGTGFLIHYRSEGDRRSVFVGFSVVLCPDGGGGRRPACDITEIRPPD